MSHLAKGVARVLVCDDHPVVRAGLCQMLAGEEGIEVVGEAADGAEAVAMSARLAPDVVLMDLRMPGTDGVEATRQLMAAALAQGRQAPSVLVVTTFDNDHDVLRAVEAGARGYLLKDTPRGQLVHAVRSAAAGATVLAPTVAAKLLTHEPGQANANLTNRELDVVRLVAEGKTNAEIGRALFIGEATVKSHLLHAFTKLGVDDRTSAVTTAMARGLIPHPSS